MSNRLVCNTDFYLYTTFAFGFYYDLGNSRRMKCLATLYCLCVALAVIIMMSMYLQTQGWLDISLRSLHTSEYLLYVIISLMKKKKYLLQYYQRMPLIDDILNTRVYTILRNWLISNIVVYFAYKIIVHLLYCYVNCDLRHLSVFPLVFKFIIICFVFSERLVLVFVFSLLYCRLRLMRETMGKNKFDCSSQGRHHPRRYIQMYETIMDRFEKTDDPVKLQLFIFNLLSVLYNVIVFAFLTHTAKYGILQPFFLLWVLSNVVSAYIPMIISAVLSDLISEEVQKVLAIIVERLMQCSNEREHSETQKLLQYIKNRPYEYSVWRVMPLNVRTQLVVASFYITTVIAIMQIKSFNE